VGKSSSTGFGIKGATPCPEGMGHWESLPAIGGMVLKKRKSGTTTNTPPPKKGPKAIFMESIEMNVGEAFDVFHRTSSNPMDVVKGFIKRSDALYGILDNYTYGERQTRYGDNIIHYKVPNNGKVIIVDEEMAKRYYGSNYDLKSQFMNCLGDDFEKFDKTIKDYAFDELKHGMQVSMGYGLKLKDLRLLNKINGFVYGNRDEVVVIQLFKSENAVPYSYSTDNGETWTKINGGTQRQTKNDIDEASVYDFNDPSEKVAKYKKKREYNDLKKDDVTNQFIKKIGKFEFYYSINEEEGEFLISVVDSIKKVMVAKAPFVMKFSEMDFEASAPYVDPEYRNIGIGTQIYKTALDFGNVVSGINKSQYAVGLWKKMYRELTNKMVAVDPETKKEYPVTMDENGDLKVDGNDNIKIYGDESRVYLKLYQN
jgi:GNAT superfamily N-acetyltransferase